MAHRQIYQVNRRVNHRPYFKRIAEFLRAVCSGNQKKIMFFQRWSNISAVHPDAKPKLRQYDSYLMYRQGHMSTVSENDRPSASDRYSTSTPGHQPNVRSMLGQRRRRWTNIDPTVG